MADTLNVTCPNCKNVYPSNASMQYCICGTKLEFPVAIKDLKDLFGDGMFKKGSSPFDMFQRPQGFSDRARRVDGLF